MTSKRNWICTIVLALIGCSGGSTIDATNADTFDTTFTAIIAGMPEAERATFSSAILTLVEDQTREKILPTHIANSRQPQLLLDPQIRPSIASKIVQSAGEVLHQKSASQIVSLAEGVVTRADNNYLDILKTKMQTLQTSLANAENQLAEKASEKAAKLASIEGHLALLDSMDAKVVKKSLKNFKRYRARGDFAFEVTNTSDQVIKDVTISLVWSAKGYTNRRHRYQLSDNNAISAEGLAPGTSTQLNVNAVSLSFSRVEGGLNSPNDVAFTAEASAAQLADGTQLNRRDLVRERDNWTARKAGVEQRQVDSFKARIEKTAEQIKVVEQRLSAG